MEKKIAYIRRSLPTRPKALPPPSRSPQVGGTMGAWLKGPLPPDGSTVPLPRFGSPPLERATTPR